MPRKLSGLNVDYLVERYAAGISSEELGKELGVSAPVVIGRLRAHGVEIRGRSQSQAARFAQSSPDQRRAVTAAANAAVRGVKRSAESVEKGLAGRAAGLHISGQMVGGFEEEFETMLIERGLKPIPQMPVDRYNLDFGIPPVAVEIHVCASSPLSNARLRKRIVELTKRGWSVIYVWISKSSPLRSGAADKVVALLDAAKRNPPALGKCWVIRGSGEEATINRRDSYHRPGVSAPVQADSANS